MTCENDDFIASLAGKERADRSFFASYHVATITAIAMLVVAICIGQFAWSIPNNISCSIVSSDTETGVAVIRSDALPDGAQLKVKVNMSKSVADDPWTAILHSMFRGSVDESAIVDASQVTDNCDGTYTVSFSSPYDSYSVSGVFYFGESQGLLDMF